MGRRNADLRRCVALLRSFLGPRSQALDSLGGHWSFCLVIEMKAVRVLAVALVALCCLPMGSAGQDLSTADTVNRQATFYRLLPGAILGSAVGIAGGYGAGMAFHRSTGCCWDGGDDPGLGEGLLGAVVGGVAGSATGAWLVRQGDSPSFAELIRGALIGAAAGLALSAAGARIADEISPDLPAVGAMVGFAVGQGLVTAWAGAASSGQ
jgi:hypothetical protein